MSEEKIKDYMAYLERLQKKHKLGLWQLHQWVLVREVARAYGLTEDEIRQLDEDL